MLTVENGTIAVVVVSKGFGFISRGGGKGDVFFHVNDLAADMPFDETLVERRVSFDLTDDSRGRGPRARRVKAA